MVESSSSAPATPISSPSPLSRRSSPSPFSLSPLSRELRLLAEQQELEQTDAALRTQLSSGLITPSSEKPSSEVIRADLVRKGFQNVTFHEFAPLQPSSIEMIRQERVLRSHSPTVELAILEFLPAEIHHLFFEECNRNLAVKDANYRKEKKRGVNMHAHFKQMTWSEYWRFWGTHMYACVHQKPSLDELYDHTPLEIKSHFLPRNRFKNIRSSLHLDDLTGLSVRLSRRWCSHVTMPKVICVDESLWRFLASFEGKNSAYLVVIPRKPAKQGVLSYEACCFTPALNLAYVLSITPRLEESISPSDALKNCLTLLKTYGVGLPLPVVMVDSAFSSEATLQWMHSQGFGFVASGNPAWYSNIHEACNLDLPVYGYRCLSDSRSWIYTGYQTSYMVTGKDTQRTASQRVFCITNAYSASETVRASASSPSAAPEPDTSTSSNSDQLEDNLHRMKSAIANIVSTYDIAVLKRFLSDVHKLNAEQEQSAEILVSRISGLESSALQNRLPSASSSTTQSTTSTSRKGVKVSKDTELYVMNSQHQSIIIDNETISNRTILSLDAKQLKQYFKRAQPHSPIPKKKDDMIRQLWNIQSRSNDRVLAERLKPYGRIATSSQTQPRLKVSLPFVHLYRQHFASIDRLDQFLAFLENLISTNSAKTRISERMFMCGISNAHTWFCEQYLNATGKKQVGEMKKASVWGKQVYKHLFLWSEQHFIP